MTLEAATVNDVCRDETDPAPFVVDGEGVLVDAVVVLVTEVVLELVYVRPTYGAHTSGSWNVFGSRVTYPRLTPSKYDLHVFGLISAVSCTLCGPSQDTYHCRDRSPASSDISVLKFQN